MQKSQSIAIIGAGFSGIAAAWDLVNKGHQVTLFEAAQEPGGLAAGFKEKNWNWSLEKHYHHIFTSDTDIQNLVKEMGLSDRLKYRAVLTTTRYNGQQFQLDSPISLLKYPHISWVAKFRTAATLAFLRFLPMWKFLEKYTAEEFLIMTMGKESYTVLWEPLFKGKFGKYAKDVNASWFWARIYVRSKQLGYFDYGFGDLATAMIEKLKEKNVTVHLATPVQKIEQQKNTVFVKIDKKKPLQFTKVLVAAPFPILKKIVDLPTKFLQKQKPLVGIGAQTLILELDKPFFKDDTYWVNINEANWPFLAVVEHTNFVDKKQYGGKSILYVGKYLESTHPDYQLNDKELLQKYHPFLQKLSTNYSKHVTKTWLFKEPFAQPIAFTNQSAHIPSFKTPFSNIFWVSMQHVYPWDRGTNYAVRVGREVVSHI